MPHSFSTLDIMANGYTHVPHFILLQLARIGDVKSNSETNSSHDNTTTPHTALAIQYVVIQYVEIIHLVPGSSCLRLHASLLSQPTCSRVMHLRTARVTRACLTRATF